IADPLCAFTQLPVHLEQAPMEVLVYGNACGHNVLQMCRKDISWRHIQESGRHFNRGGGCELGTPTSVDRRWALRRRGRHVYVGQRADAASPRRRGRHTMNVVPSVAVDSTLTSPPCARTI